MNQPELCLASPPGHTDPAFVPGPLWGEARCQLADGHPDDHFYEAPVSVKRPPRRAAMHWGEETNNPAAGPDASDDVQPTPQTDIPAAVLEAAAAALRWDPHDAAGLNAAEEWATGKEQSRNEWRATTSLGLTAATPHLEHRAVDDAVEAAAAAMYGEGTEDWSNVDTWAEVDSVTRQEWRVAARAMITAAVGASAELPSANSPH